ncbi:MAG: hypothetical protein ACYC8W_11680 [Candidatus Tyrphobacter sp.]
MLLLIFVVGLVLGLPASRFLGSWAGALTLGLAFLAAYLFVAAKQRFSPAVLLRSLPMLLGGLAGIGIATTLPIRGSLAVQAAWFVVLAAAFLILLSLIRPRH